MLTYSMLYLFTYKVTVIAYFMTTSSAIITKFILSVWSSLKPSLNFIIGCLLVLFFMICNIVVLSYRSYDTYYLQHYHYRVVTLHYNIAISVGDVDVAGYDQCLKPRGIRILYLLLECCLGWCSRDLHRQAVSHS